MTVGSGGTSIGNTETGMFVTISTASTVTKRTLSRATLNGTATTSCATIPLLSDAFKSIVVKEYKKGIPYRLGIIPQNDGDGEVQQCRRYTVDNDTKCTNLTYLTPGDKYYIPVYLQGDTVNYAALQNSLSGYHTVDSAGNIVITIPAGTEVYLSQDTNSYATLKTCYYCIPV